MNKILYSGCSVMIRRGKGCVVVDTSTERVEEFSNAMVPLRFSYWDEVGVSQADIKNKAMTILHNKQRGRNHGN